VISDLIPAAERDVVCGAVMLGLDLPAVLGQVPDFGERVWVTKPAICALLTALSGSGATNDAKIKSAVTRAAVEAVGEFWLHVLEFPTQLSRRRNNGAEIRSPCFPQRALAQPTSQ
jgi:hypothetical protein